MEQRPKKLLDQVRDAIPLKNYAYSTEKAYVDWIDRPPTRQAIQIPADRSFQGGWSCLTIRIINPRLIPVHSQETETPSFPVL